MNILLTALELSPFSEQQSSAQIVAGLAKALRLLGHNVTVAAPYLPAYESAGLMLGRRLSPLVLSEGRTAVAFDVQLSSGVSLVLLKGQDVEFSDEIPLDEQAAPLGIFAEAVARLAEESAEAGRPFDVVHAQGAAAGLCFVHLTGTKAAGTARVLSVQDAIRSGEFPESARDALGISEAPSGAFNSADGICLLKGLLSEADAVIAPSDSYARQLQTPERHGALARAFQNASPWGVLSGVDLAIYNPSTDPSLVSRFDAPDPSNKARNKVAVLAELKLDFDPTCPLVFCEITEEGECASPTLLSAISGIVRNDVDLVLSVPASRQKEFASAADTLEGRFKVLVEPAAAARRRLLAAADFYLSIRRNDPFAQQLQQAARYGAIPIAYRVDAVEDAVIDLDAQLKTGTGLLYDVMTQRALTSVVGRAVAVFRNAAYGDLLRRVLRQDAAWDRPARRHVQIYRQAIQP